MTMKRLLSAFCDVCNLLKFIMWTRLYCRRQLETALHQLCYYALHITFNTSVT